MKLKLILNIACAAWFSYLFYLAMTVGLPQGIQIVLTLLVLMLCILNVISSFLRLVFNNVIEDRSKW